MMKTPARTAATVLSAALLCTTPLAAQHRSVPPPAAYAIEGVTVVGPGLQEEPGVTIVVRGGLIEAMDAGLAIPADDVTATGGAQGEQRRRGIVAAAVHAGDGIAPGRSAVLLNRVDAETSRALIARPDAGLSMSLQTAQGVYPSTLLGVMATIRQAFLDAERQATLESAFANGRAGMTMPDWDPDSEVLRAAAAGETPVFFRAADSEEIRRVLGLADEIGIRPDHPGGRRGVAARGGSRRPGRPCPHRHGLPRAG